MSEIEDKNKKCYRCGVELDECGSLILQDVYGREDIWLCQKCINKNRAEYVQMFASYVRDVLLIFFIVALIFGIIRLLFL